MKRRRTRYLGWLLCGTAVVLLVIPTTRTWIVGRVSGQPFFHGRSALYWEGRLGAHDEELREQARQELRGGDGDAVPVLIAILKTAEEPGRAKKGTARHEAVDLLVDIGPPAVPALCELLEGGPFYQDVHAAVCRIGPEAVPGLMSALENPSANIRRNAAAVLGEIGPKAKPAVPSLIVLLKGEDENARLVLNQA